MLALFQVRQKFVELLVFGLLFESCCSEVELKGSRQALVSLAILLALLVRPFRTNAYYFGPDFWYLATTASL